MELIECVTCGSHSFANGKCDYCGNKYETTKLYSDDNEAEAYAQEFHEYTNRTEVTELGFEDTPEGKKTLKVMIWVSISIIWFAVTVFIPPLFLMTICGLIIWICNFKRKCKKSL